MPKFLSTLLKPFKKINTAFPFKNRGLPNCLIKLPIFSAKKAPNMNVQKILFVFARIKELNQLLKQNLLNKKVRSF